MRSSKRAAQRKHQRSGSVKNNLLISSTDALFRDDSALLLSVASQFLREEDNVDSITNTAYSFAPIVDFPSFQALLHAATSAAPVDEQSEALQSTLETRLPPATANAPSTRTQKRRERNRISCRKTRLKRKMEHASEELLAHQRAAHNAFLSGLHHELAQFDKQQQQQNHRANHAETLERERLMRQFIVRSLHFQLVDPEYDATWCVVNEPIVEILSRRNQASDNSTSMRSSVMEAPQQVLLTQWRAIVADIENPSLEILQIHSEKESVKDDDSQDSQLSCQWRLAGVSKQHLQCGRVEKRTTTGVTNVLFHGRSIQSIDMRVGSSATESAHAAV